VTQEVSGFKLGEFEGYVKSNLEYIKKEMKEMKMEVSALRGLLTAIRIKTYCIGAIVSLLVTVVVLLLGKHLIS